MLKIVFYIPSHLQWQKIKVGYKTNNQKYGYNNLTRINQSPIVNL